jgi:hypothetical protein
MARPLSKPEELLHPRRIRRSPTTGTQHNVPEPSKREKKRWASLVEACMMAVLATDRVDNILPKVKVKVAFSDYAKQRPKWFPTGRFISRDGKAAVVEYASDLLLLILWQYKLAEYNPSMVHKAKPRGVLNEIVKSLDNIGGVDL